MVMKKEFSLGYVEFIAPDIFKVVYNKKDTVDFETIMEVVALRTELNVPTPYRLLGVHAQSVMQMDDQLKVFLSQNEDAANMRIADANVIKSGLSLEANHYKTHFKPIVKTEFFNNEEDAIAWLKEQ